MSNDILSILNDTKMLKRQIEYKIRGNTHNHQFISWQDPSRWQFFKVLNKKKSKDQSYSLPLSSSIKHCAVYVIG